MSPVSGPQIFTGTFIHSKSRTELEYLHDAVVCVDENGIIAKVSRDATADVATTVKQLRESLGWGDRDVPVHACKEGQFFFPGFVGM